MKRLSVQFLVLQLFVLSSLCACRKQQIAPSLDPLYSNLNSVQREAASKQSAIAKGCEINLSGNYHLRKNRTFRYIVEDDGTHLIIRPVAQKNETKNSMEMVVDRTTSGFVGKILGEVETRAGNLCKIAFEAEIVACSCDSVTLRSEDVATVDEQCHIKKIDDKLSEKILIRDW